MSLIDHLKEEALGAIEEEIDTDEERAEIKAEFAKFVDWASEQKDFKGPDWLYEMALKKIFNAGVDALAKALDDGEESP